MCPFAIMADEEKRTLSDKFMLRLPDGMRDRIKLAADANNRSMNAEIVATLEEKYPGRSALEDFKDILEAFADIAARAADPNLNEQDRALVQLELNMARDFILKEVGLSVETKQRTPQPAKGEAVPTISERRRA